MDYQKWLAKLGCIINHFSKEWLAWDEWESYYQDGFSPEEAYKEAFRAV